MSGAGERGPCPSGGGKPCPPHASPADRDAAYFTDRCDKLIDTRGLTAGGPDLTPCKLKLGHDGPHEPIEIGKQTISESPAAQVQELDLFDALDLPPALTPLQDAYWVARREWQERDAAYRLVLKEMLEREEANPHV